MAQQMGFNLSPDEFYRRFFSQQQIATGKPSRADEVSAMIGAINQANQSYELPRQQLQLQRDRLGTQNAQFQQEMALRRSQTPSPSQAWISGAGAMMTGAGALGTGVAALGKQGLLPSWAGGGPSTSALATDWMENQLGVVGGGAGAGSLVGADAATLEAAGYGTEEAGALGYVGAEGGVGAGVGAMGFLPPVAGGLLGGALGAKGGEWAGEQLGIGGKRERDIGGGMLGGAAAGFAAGSFFPGPGNIVGAVIGGIVGGVSQLFGGDGGCIIVSCCHGRDSEEVNITREYRDKYMSKESIRGYYAIAEKIVPKMEANPMFKKWVKREIVDNLIEYGKRELGYSDKCGIDAEAVSIVFLQACKDAGEGLESYTRSNGEVV